MRASIFAQNHMQWLTKYAYPECLTDDENDDQWDTRIDPLLKDSGMHGREM
jgi:hypothetical protein